MVRRSIIPSVNNLIVLKYLEYEVRSVISHYDILDRSFVNQDFELAQLHTNDKSKAGPRLYAD